MGRVIEFMPSQQALAATRVMEAQLKAKISPAYLPLPRINVEAYPRNGGWNGMVALPEGMTVKIGDVIEVATRYRDPEMPCNFIPWTVTRLVDHVD